MNSVTQNDMYHDYPSSPTRRTASYQTQSLNRQNSRGFDSFAQPQNGLYGADDSTNNYDDPRFNDRMNTTMQPNYNAYNAGMSAWNGTAYGQNNHLAALGATDRRPARGGRTSLPQGWMGADPAYGYAQPQFGSLPPIRQDDINEEDLIPTAIVIKNIPFAVRKEQLTNIMTDMGLPLPYAFNYHFDNGVFRGLAFANFTTPEETQAVIQHLNNFSLDGRKLRVEYKKMLPQAERDRIEREKRERRGQLEEQHRPVMGSQLQASTSLSSIGMQARTPSPGSSRSPAFDMNDPACLSYYGQLVLFKNDPSKGDILDFPSNLPPDHRRSIHAIAHQMDLSHQSEGQGSERFVRISRKHPENSLAATNGGRSLHRSATTDFGQARMESIYGSSRNAQSYLGMPDIISGATREAQLRGAKSHADLRSYTPSPAQSTASFPANVGNNGSRYEYNYGGHDSPAFSKPQLPNSATTIGGSNEDFLANGLGNLNLDRTYGQPHGSPQRMRQVASWDRSHPGPIGGHRAFSANLEDAGRSRTIGSARQARAPPAATNSQGPTYPRASARNSHRNRGSDDLSSPNGVDGHVDQV